MTADLVNQKLDAFTGAIGDNWHALLLAQATLQLGEGMLNTISDNANLEVRIGSAIQVEPIPILISKKAPQTGAGALAAVCCRCRQ